MFPVFKRISEKMNRHPLVPTLTFLSLVVLCVDSASSNINDGKAVEEAAGWDRIPGNS